MLKAGVVVPGDVIIGPGGDPEDVIDTKASTTIEGDSYAAKDEIDFPSVVVPEPLASMGSTGYAYSFGVGIGSPNGVGTQHIKLNSISIPQSGVQELYGPCVVYVIGQTILGQDSALVIKPGSSLTLYLGGNMEAKNAVGIINETGDASALKIYGLDSCYKIDLKAKGDTFFGYVYAPNADLDVYAANQMAGAFVGKSFNLKSSVDFVYVPPPWSAGNNDPDSYLMQRWWEE